MKFLLAGYFGFGNFGDEAILKYAVDILRFYYKNDEISIITQTPHIIKKTFGAKGVYRFDFKEIFTQIKNCDYLIFPGGSVLQDVTSLKSIMYYLGLITLANIFRKKVILLAQGIGPINNKFAQKLTYKLLKKESLITLRDEKSYDTLLENGVFGELTADLLWAFTQNPLTKQSDNNMILGEVGSVQKKKIGIQLRNWSDLTIDKLEILAKAILKSFPFFEFDYKLISLQKNSDEQVLIELGKIMHKLSKQAKIELYTQSDIEDNIRILQSMDYLIAMRFHAGLCAINAERSLLMLSYDPKTEEFCKELGLKYIDIKDLNPQIYKSYTQSSNANVLHNLKILAQNSDINNMLIRIPLIKGYNTKQDVEKSKDLLIHLGYSNFDIFEYKTDNRHDRKRKK